MDGVDVITKVFRAETSVSKPSTWASGILNDLYGKALFYFNPLQLLIVQIGSFLDRLENRMELDHISQGSHFTFMSDSASAFSAWALFAISSATIRCASCGKRKMPILSENHVWTNLEERCSELLKFSLHFISDP